MGESMTNEEIKIECYKLVIDGLSLPRNISVINSDEAIEEAQKIFEWVKKP